MEYALKYDACAYRRREPEQKLLHKALIEHLETFLDRARTADFGLPRHVENELRDFVKCGVLAHGFVRVHSGAENDRIGYLDLGGDGCRNIRAGGARPDLRLPLSGLVQQK